VRVGVVGLIPSEPARIDSAAVARVAELGFSGVSVMLGDPGAASPDQLEAVREVLSAAGISVAQANGAYPSLVDPNPLVRRAGIDGLMAHMHSAKLLGAATLYVRPGGLNPGGPWWPHPDHHRPEPFERLIDSLQQVAAAAETAGVVLALEGHALSVLDTPERAGELLRRVASPALGFNMDPVNFIGSVWDAWRPQRVYDRLLREAGSRVVAAHWKDYRVEDRLVLHVTEVAPGAGLVDHARWLRQLHAVQPDTWVLIEHLPPEAIPAAKQVLDAALAAAGLEWQAGP